MLTWIDCRRKFILLVTAHVAFHQVSFAQERRNTAIFLSAEYFHTTYDRTKFGNPDGFGFGAQAFLNRKSMFQPVVDVSAQHFSSDKVFRTDDSGNEIIQVSNMFTAMGGAAFVPVPYVSVAVLAGPVFLNNGVRFALKPGVAFYFPRNQRLSLRASFLNVFHRDKPTGQDLRGFDIGFAVRVY